MSKDQTKSTRAEIFTIYFSLFVLVISVCMLILVISEGQKQKAIYSEIDKLNKETALLAAKTKQLQALTISAQSK